MGISEGFHRISQDFPGLRGFLRDFADYRGIFHTVSITAVTEDLSPRDNGCAAKKGLDSPLGSESTISSDSNRTSGKGMTMLLQIGEFSKICQVSVKTLHHYDKIGLLAPARVDQFTGYRYYRVEQIDTMNYIQRLKRYGFSLEEIQHIITLSDEKEISMLLRQQRDKLKREQREKATILNELQTHISVFERTGDVMTYQKGYQIEIKNSPAINILAARARMSVDDFGKYYGTLFERVPRDRVTPTGLTGARYYDQEFNPESSDIEVFIGIREKEKADTTIDSCECAMTVHHGGYSTLSEAYGAIVSWIMENGYEIAGAPFELYIKTQFQSLAPEDWETEVYFPVRKK